MTTSTAHEVRKRKLAKATTPRLMVLHVVERALEHSEENAWPSERYRQDPVAFFREVLGVEPWHRQIEIIEAIRDHKRVAVSSGHKVSKSHTMAGVALWFFCCYEDARVVMSSTTSRQVDAILWRELRMMHARSKVPIGGDLHELARSGLKAEDFREIVGFTAKEAEAVAGISGRNLLYLLDEASGIDDAIFEAIEGNRAGGARLAMFSNPTRRTGEFAAAFHEKAALYKTITVSSEETPNVVEGREVIPGLATREWVEEKKREWGVESALYMIRVRGLFPTKEEGKVISVHLITAAEQRWEETPAEGRLYIGVDAAGDSGTGDESAFAARRGRKVVRLTARLGLTPDGHVTEVVGMISELKYAGENEMPVVIVDADGLEGSRVYAAFRTYLDSHENAFELVRFRGSEEATRGENMDLMRDAVWANAREWIRDGGAIPPDAKLAKDLNAPEFFDDTRGRTKVTGKKELRKLLGRSPDRGDALCLAVWTPVTYAESVKEQEKQNAAAAAQQETQRIPSLDPYGGLNAWRS